MRLRVPAANDAADLASLLTRNRDYFRSGEPLRSDEYYTVEHQARVITDAAAARESDTAFMFLIEHHGSVAGRANLTSVIRGAFQSASVGYVVDEHHSGKGVATAALRMLVELAFGELHLHRLQGETLVDNVASQRVLRACGFVHYGTAPDYLRIDGRWQTNHLYQLINPLWVNSEPASLRDAVRVDTANHGPS